MSDVKSIAGVVKEFGAINTLIAAFIFIVLFFSSQEQKQEIVDTYVLFKNENYPAQVFVLLIMIAVIILQHVYYRKTLKVKTEENKRLGKEKSKLQEELLQIKLHSSDNDKNPKS